MKFTSTALALALLASSAPALAQYGQYAPTPPAPPATPATPGATTVVKPSARANKALMELQAAITAHDTAAIPGKIAAAKAVASTKEDRYLVARFQLNAAATANDLDQASEAIKAIEASGVISQSEVAGLYAALGGSYYSAKKLDQAAVAFERQIALDPTATDSILTVANIRAEQGRSAEALQMVQRLIQASSSQGRKADENLYRHAVNLAYEAKLPAAVDIAREWLATYPSDSSWRNSIAIYRNLRGTDPSTLVDIIRLSRLTRAMQRANDYEVYAIKLIEQGNYAEAKAAIDEGIAAGTLKVSDPTSVEILGAVKGKIPTAADLAASEKSAAIPNAFLRVGDRYYGAGNFQKAAELYRTALAKGVDPNLANLRLGEALAQSGDKARAAAALSAVSGPLTDIAKFWLLYVQRQG